jgi:prepilin-type N-terminal cleavage/methylation domain-containing protein
VSPRPDIRSAFSLIELLVVIAIIAVLAALALPAFNSIQNASGLTKTASDIAGMLEQARAYAMAQNTYVWIGFRKDGTDSLTVGVVASKTGSSNPSANIVQLGKISRFENVQLFALPDFGARPADSVDQLKDATDATLAFTIGTNSFSSQVIRWNSRGEARIDAAQLSRHIEIGLQASAGGEKRNASNAAALQIGGLSGAVIVYRP